MEYRCIDKREYVNRNQLQIADEEADLVWPSTFP
jgi:hypothetical protein